MPPSQTVPSGPKMTAVHSRMLLSFGAPEMPFGASVCRRRKSRINRRRALVDMVYRARGLETSAEGEKFLSRSMMDPFTSPRSAIVALTAVTSSFLLMRIVLNAVSSRKKRGGNDDDDDITSSSSTSSASSSPKNGSRTQSFAAELVSDGVQTFDHNHIIHPYTFLSFTGSEEQQKKYCFPVVRDACGAYLHLDMGDGGEPIKVLDGISSWWSCLHGYRNEVLVEAMQKHLSALRLPRRRACARNGRKEGTDRQRATQEKPPRT